MFFGEFWTHSIPKGKLKKVNLKLILADNIAGGMWDLNRKTQKL